MCCARLSPQQPVENPASRTNGLGSVVTATATRAGFPRSRWLGDQQHLYGTSDQSDGALTRQVVMVAADGAMPSVKELPSMGVDTCVSTPCSGETPTRHIRLGVGWYKLQVTDNISVTKPLFYLSRLWSGHFG